MATRNEKQIRLELPSTSGVDCEVIEGTDKYIMNFYQNDRQIKSSSFPKKHLNQDRVVDLLSEAGIDFFSFSAIFDVADLLVKTIIDVIMHRLEHK